MRHRGAGGEGGFGFDFALCVFGYEADAVFGCGDQRFDRGADRFGFIARFGGRGAFGQGLRGGLGAVGVGGFAALREAVGFVFGAGQVLEAVVGEAALGVELGREGGAGRQDMFGPQAFGQRARFGQGEGLDGDLGLLGRGVVVFGAFRAGRVQRPRGLVEGEGVARRSGAVGVDAAAQHLTGGEGRC